MNDNIGRTRAAVWLREGMVVVCAAALVLLAVVFTGGAGPELQMQPEAASAQQEGGIVLHSLTYTQTAVLQGNELNFEQPMITVKIWVDGKNTEYQVQRGTTVEKALEQAGVQLNTLDLVNLPLSRRIEDTVQIDVERRAWVTQREETELPFEVVRVETPLLSEGTVRVLTQGQPGLEVATYERYIVDGEIVEETLLSKGVESTPVTQTEMVGFNGASVSQLDLGWEFQDGVPVGYATVLNSQRAAGYWANPGARTASGREAMVGHVAVNPNVIPYGSKLYIQSSDGSFVYGYAIAADTGTSLMNGVIDVDLFYDTYTEAALNGMRSVDIYILEYPQ